MWGSLYDWLIPFGIDSLRIPFLTLSGGSVPGGYLYSVGAIFLDVEPIFCDFLFHFSAGSLRWSDTLNQFPQSIPCRSKACPTEHPRVPPPSLSDLIAYLKQTGFLYDPDVSSSRGSLVLHLLFLHVPPSFLFIPPIPEKTSWTQTGKEMAPLSHEAKPGKDQRLCMQKQTPHTPCRTCSWQRKNNKNFNNTINLTTDNCFKTEEYL